MAIGPTSKATGTMTMAIGAAAKAQGSYSIALGYSSEATGAYGLAVGSLAKGYGAYSVAIGASCTAGSASYKGTTTASYGAYAIAIGYGVQSTYASSGSYIKIGNKTNNYTCYEGTGTSWTTKSDVRDKIDIEPLVNGLDIIKEIQPIIYRNNFRINYGDIFDYDREEHAKGTNAEFNYRAGFKAQELAKFFDDKYGDEEFNNIVSHDIIYNDETGEEADCYGVAGADLIPFMFQAIKEQQELIEELQEKVEKLEKIIYNK